jgi:hypothetical protein
VCPAIMPTQCGYCLILKVSPPAFTWSGDHHFALV